MHVDFNVDHMAVALEADFQGSAWSARTSEKVKNRIWVLTFYLHSASVCTILTALVDYGVCGVVLKKEKKIYQ